MIFLTNIKEFDSNKYEYRKPKELEYGKANFIRVPMSIITNVELDKMRVALLSYLLMYRGLNGKVMFSIPKFVEWAGFKSDTHTDGMNDKVICALDYLNAMGFVVYRDTLTRTSTIELEFDLEFHNEECENDFAILYIDEIDKIANYKRENLKNAYLNSFSVLLVFAYLRRKIFRRQNKLKPEEQSADGIEGRKKRCPEAYASTYKEIGDVLDLTATTVSKAVRVLQQLNLIVAVEAYHVKMEDGEYRTPYTMFANYEKRESRFLLDSGLAYSHNEMKYKAEQIKCNAQYGYMLKFEKADLAS